MTTEATEVAPETTAVETITIDNVVYNVIDLSDQQRQLINIFKQWKDSETLIQAELESLKSVYLDAARKTQLELMKTQAALRQLGNEISLSVKSSTAANESSPEEGTSLQ